MSRLITSERIDRVVVATIDNPPHQLMTSEIVDELDALVREADADTGIGAVVLTGAHTDRFLAHFDVGALLDVARQGRAVSPGQAMGGVRAVGALERLPGSSEVLRRSPAAGIVLLRHFHDVLLRIGRSGAVFIAAINGNSLGGGCELSLACDLRLMAQGPYAIGQPEILLGFPPGGGGTQRLSRLIGRARALEICLEGTMLSPDDAHAIGLVNRVVPQSEVLDEAVTMAHRLSRRSKAAVAATKRAVLEGGSMPLSQGLQVEQAGFLSTLGSPPAIRAMEAYVEHFDRTGELPSYDPAVREHLLDGTFVDMTS